MTYRKIQPSEKAVDAPLAAQTVQALDENLDAAAKGETGAPVVHAGWHPFDVDIVASGGGGIIWDHAIHGSVTSVISPDFEQGYQYRFLFQDVQNGGLSADLEMELYAATGATYRGPQPISSTGTGVFSGQVTVWMPRLISRAHIVQAAIAVGAVSGSGVVTPVSCWFGHNTAQQITRARFSGFPFVGGRIICLRQREYRTA